MPMDMPPDVGMVLTAQGTAMSRPAYVERVAAPECQYLTNAQAQVALDRLKARLPSTSFDNARPSEICGLVRVQLQSGTVVYTEPTGRYLLLTFALDTHSGSPADVSSDLENQIERRQQLPLFPIPGIFQSDQLD